MKKVRHKPTNTYFYKGSEYYYSNGLLTTKIPSFIVESSGEDWEEIREYQIEKITNGKIMTITRLSDKRIFSIGDYIDPGEKIIKFVTKKDSDELRIITDLGYSWLLEDIEKIEMYDITFIGKIRASLDGGEDLASYLKDRYDDEIKLLGVIGIK